MYLLVDYENVVSEGLKGLEYLSPEDNLMIFYSDQCKLIEKKYVKAISESGCIFSTIKLKHAGKNALDFYIASKVAEIITIYDGKTIGIVSKDKGFEAIRDFWKFKEPEIKIVFMPDILQILMSVYDENEKFKALRELNNKAQMCWCIRKIKLIRKLRNAYIEQCGSCYENFDFWELSEKLTGFTPSKVAYTNLLRDYGIREGLYLYRAAKQVYQETPKVFVV